MNKKELRKEMLLRRDALTTSQIFEGGMQISYEVSKNSLWMENSVIYLYASFGSEVSTTSIFKNAQLEGKKVAFPRVISKTKMEFYEVSHLNQLKVGHFGIYEPEFNELKMEEPGLVLLPGLAFDRDGNRLGYGGGYYDRYLSLHPYHKTAGLAYDFQVVDNVYSENTDIAVQEVISCINLS